MIGMALINKPRLILADEPTTGLDVTVQLQVLELLRALVRDEGCSAIVVTHDLGVVVEEGITSRIFGEPQHPYTRALIAAVLETRRDSQAKPFALHGEPMSVVNLPPGVPCRPAVRL